MVIREVKEWELQELLSLYLFLHEKALPDTCPKTKVHMRALRLLLS